MSTSIKEQDKDILEIATALVGGSITLFIGTGFSMFMTEGKAPSWIQLLIKCVEKLDNQELAELLFSEDAEGRLECKFELTIAAQIIENEYKANNMNLRETICEIISNTINEETINSDHIETVKDFLLTYPNINVVTTNYDDIISKHILPKVSKVYVEGAILPRFSEIKNIYHIHGSIEVPDSLVVTQDDYFKFQHRESYISRKFYTLLQETTTVIIGYSLNDFNLSRILNESKYTKSENLKRNDIFYISYTNVDDVYKEYYYATYGIKVIDNISLDRFFRKIKIQSKLANKIVDGVNKIEEIISGRRVYTDQFLKLNNAFDIILSRVFMAAYELSDPKVVELFVSILEKKKELTREDGAWDQYSHLAKWLIDFAVVFEGIEDEPKERYLKLVDYSFNRMSKETYGGYSWEAYQIWASNWDRIPLLMKKKIINMADDTSYHRITKVPKLIEKFKTTLNISN
jgi:SIR2-like domain